MNERLFKDRVAWRAWLAKNHASKTVLWLVYYKKHTDKKSIRYEEAVEEALCYGWIDSIVKRIDDEKYMQKFTPRKEKSNWSESNKKRVAKLIKNGTMAEVGLAKVTAAKRNGSWQRLENVDKNPTVPDDLAQALAKNGRAKANFESFAPSHRKQYLYWLLDAKRADTRERRIKEIVKRAVELRKPGI